MDVDPIGLCLWWYSLIQTRVLVFQWDRCLSWACIWLFSSRCIWCRWACTLRASKTREPWDQRPFSSDTEEHPWCVISISRFCVVLKDNTGDFDQITLFSLLWPHWSVLFSIQTASSREHTSVVWESRRGGWRGTRDWRHNQVRAFLKH